MSVPRVTVTFPGPQGPAGTIPAGTITDDEVASDADIAQSKVHNLPADLAALADADAAHTADTTNIHGIADTSQLVSLVGGKIPSGLLPALAVIEWTPVADQAAMLALTVEKGDGAVLASDGSSWVFRGGDSTQLANWLEISTDAVVSVNGQTGAVVLPKILSGTGAQRLALDTSLLPVNTLYFSTDEGASVKLLGWNGTAWSPWAGANSHAERHIPGGSDPLAWSTIHARGTLGARPTASTTNASLFYLATDVENGTLYLSTGSSWVAAGAGVNASLLVGSAEQTARKNAQDGYPGLVNGHLAQEQMPGTFVLPNQPIAASAVLRTLPRSTSGFGQVTYNAIGDHAFTLAVETSDDGYTFTNAVTIVAVQFGTTYVASAGITPANAYVQGVITNGGTAQSAISITTQLAAVPDVVPAGSILDSHVSASAAIGQSKISGLTASLNARLNWRGVWAASTAYAVNDLLLYNSGSGVVAYQVNTAFTSSGSFSATNLTALSSTSGGADGSPIPTYTVATLPTPAVGNNTQLAYVSDLSGGALVVSNGSSAWNQVAKGLTQAPQAHAQSHGRAGSDELVILGGHRRDSAVESGPRWAFMTSAASMTSGRIVYQYVTPSVDTTISKLEFWSNSTIAATVTTVRFGLYTVDGSGNLTLVARTANDATIFTVASTQYQKALDTTGGYPATYAMLAGTRYAIAVIVVATTVPTLFGNSNQVSTGLGLAPRLVARQDSQTDLPTSVAAGSLSNHSILLYAAGVV